MLDQRLSDNGDGKLYIGDEAALFRLHIPALSDPDMQSISFQLYGHPHVFVRQRADGEMYLDKSDGSQEFSKYMKVRIVGDHYT